MRIWCYHLSMDATKRENLSYEKQILELFKEGGGYTICEANTFPGFKGLEKASGVNVAGKVFEAMQRQLHKKGGVPRSALKAAATHSSPDTRH